jgi:hypothetical protein
MNRKLKQLIKVLVDKMPKRDKYNCIVRALGNDEITIQSAIDEINRLDNE